MIEGSLLFACGIVKRSPTPNGALPVQREVSEQDKGPLPRMRRGRSRAELWFRYGWPLRTTVLRSLFSEGRSNVEKRRARTDRFRQAVAASVDRGIDSFQRYGFLKRNDGLRHRLGGSWSGGTSADLSHQSMGG